MSIKKVGDRVFRVKTDEAEKAYEDLNILSREIKTGLEIVVQTAKNESVKLSGSRSIVVEGNLTDEQEYEIHKDLFLDAAADVITAGHSIFKQWNRLPRSGWPTKLGATLDKPGEHVSMDDVRGSDE